MAIKLVMAITLVAWTLLKPTLTTYETYLGLRVSSDTLASHHDRGEAHHSDARHPLLVRGLQLRRVCCREMDEGCVGR